MRNTSPPGRSHYYFFVNFLAVQRVLAIPLPYVVHLLFLKDVWIRTQSAIVAGRGRRATNLAIHPLQLSHPSIPTQTLIPLQLSHPSLSNFATYPSPTQPPIPLQLRHPYHSNLATHPSPTQPPIPLQLSHPSSPTQPPIPLQLSHPSLSNLATLATHTTPTQPPLPNLATTPQLSPSSICQDGKITVNKLFQLIISGRRRHMLHCIWF